MSVGAICFTSSGSKGGCWVVLVCPCLFFFGKQGFFPHTRLTPKKKVYVTYTKKKPIEKNNATCAKKKLRDLRQKKSELRLFPQSSYAFLTTTTALQPMLVALVGCRLPFHHPVLCAMDQNWFPLPPATTRMNLPSTLLPSPAPRRTTASFSGATQTLWW